MKLMELLRKGLGYVLMSMGVSRPGTKPKPAGSSAPKKGPEA